MVITACFIVISRDAMNAAILILAKWAKGSFWSLPNGKEHIFATEDTEGTERRKRGEEGKRGRGEEEKRGRRV